MRAGAKLAGSAVAVACVMALGCASAVSPQTLADSDAAMAAKNYGEARAGYRLYLEDAEVVDLDETARIKTQIGRTYFEQRSYSQASKWFAEVVDDHATSSSVWEALYYGGINYVRIGECARATLYFGKLLQAGLTLEGERGAQVSRFRASAEKHLKTIEQDMAHSHKLCPIGSAPGL